MLETPTTTRPAPLTTCSGCAGRVPTRICLHTGAVQHRGPGFVVVCATPTWSVIGPRASSLHTGMATERLAASTAARLDAWIGTAGAHSVVAVAR